MKRTFVIILLICILIGILVFCLIPYHRIMNTTPVVWHPTLRVFQTFSGYNVYLLDGKHIDGSIYFSADGQLLGSRNVKPVSQEDAMTFLGKYAEEIVVQCGAPHADVGSGFYIPAYVSEDARLIALYMDDCLVSRVVAKDLRTNNLVYEYELREE